MSDSLQYEIDQLRTALTTLETQREILGEAIEPALESVREKLAVLEVRLSAGPETLPEEKRRVITILFSDVVGSTALAERLDPEEWRAIIARVHETAGEIIHRYKGQVAQYLGDGLLAFFGAQTASEGNPENAVRAALEFQASLAKEVRPLPQSEELLQVRIGIHTGLVVVGDLGADVHKEVTATGGAMNLAARLQSAAPPGAILISQDTYRHVRGVFDFTPQPPLQIKGKRQPLHNFQVRRARPRPFRTTGRGIAGIVTSTVGREAELEQLQSAYLQAFEGKNIVWVLLTGEAGVGKSRLVGDLQEWLDLRPETITLFRARAYEGDASRPYALIQRLWFDRFLIGEDTPRPRAEDRWLAEFQALTGSDEVEPAHALGLLAGLTFIGSPYLEGLRDDPEQAKGRAIVVSRALVRTTRANHPIVLLLEDLHDADASSLAYLAAVFQQSESAEHGIFVLSTARTGWDPPKEFTLLADRPRSDSPDGGRSTPGYEFQTFDLPPLTDDATHGLVEEILQNVEDVPPEVISMVVERVEGVPYYAEEMVHWFLDQGIINQRMTPWLFQPDRMRETPLPATLQHMMLTRLTALSEAERLALQCGSIFGREFWTGAVEFLGVTGADEVLPRLRTQGFLEVRAESSFEGQAEWAFRQNMLQEATYASVLKRERTHLHRLAGTWLQSQSEIAGRLEDFTGALGKHAERAGDLSEAADWYLLAGEHTRRRGGLLEARHYFDRALAVLPPVDRRRRWRALIGRVDTLQHDQAAAADIDTLVELAGAFDDNNRLGEALYRRAYNHLWTGQTQHSSVEFHRVLMLARQTGNRPLEVHVMASLAHANLYLGNLAEAERLAEDALRQAVELRDENLLAAIILPLAIYYDSVWDLGKVLVLATQFKDLAGRRGHHKRPGLATNLLGGYLIQVGNFKAAQSAFQQSVQLAEQNGQEVTRAHAVKSMGSLYWRLGDLRKSMELLAEAEVFFTRSGDLETLAEIRLYQALALESLEDWGGAAERYGRVRKIGIDLGKIALRNEGLAGSARCAFQQGRLEAAQQDIAEVWGSMLEHGLVAMYFPIIAYHTCADLFDALGDLERGTEAVDAGHRTLLAVAEKISDPEDRRSFLRNIPENRALVALWERTHK